MQVAFKKCMNRKICVLMKAIEDDNHHHLHSLPDENSFYCTLTFKNTKKYQPLSIHFTFHLHSVVPPSTTKKGGEQSLK